MADQAPIFAEEDEEARERAIAEARVDLDAGNGVDNVRVRAWLKELAAGRRLPPPRSNCFRTEGGRPAGLVGAS